MAALPPDAVPDLSDLLAFAGFALLTIGSYLEWGSPSLLVSGAVLLGFGVWSSVRIARQIPQPPLEQDRDGPVD